LDFDKTHIEDYYESIAFQSFRIWTSEAKKVFPNYQYEVLDEQELIDDLNLAVRKSLKVLFENDYEKNKRIMGWKTGFFIAALAQQLNVYWLKRYIYVRNDVFKRLVWFKSMLMYMEGDEISQISVNRLSKNLMDSSFPFEVWKPFDLEATTPLHLLADLSFKENWIDQRNWLQGILEKEFHEFLAKNTYEFLLGSQIHQICCPHDSVMALQQFLDANYEKHLQNREK
jgi:hypothetical protein